MGRREKEGPSPARPWGRLGLDGRRTSSRDPRRGPETQPGAGVTSLRLALPQRVAGARRRPVSPQGHLVDVKRQR